MNPLSTEDFPYTLGYVQELLNLDESQLLQYARALGLSQKRDDRTGKLIFTYRDVELLKRAVELVRAGEDLNEVAHRLGNPAPQSPPQGQPLHGYSVLDTSSQALSPVSSRPQAAPGMGAMPTARPQNTPLGSVSPVPVAPSTAGMSSQAMASLQAQQGRDNLAVMVETVSQVKEGILKDLSRLLDDKLSGLDEVVVELIRCKSENDSLKKRLEDAQREKAQLERELSLFRPVQFGFYKKVQY